jgi:hypothetical protein
MRKARQEVFTATKKADELQGWDRAIAEAERQIAEQEQRTAKLKLARETFQEMKERGEPFIPKQSEITA